MIVVRGLDVRYPSGAGTVHAVKEMSFSFGTGVAYGLVGESGSGKSTVLRAIAGLIHDWEGMIEIDQRALQRYQVDYTWIDPPRHLYRYRRASGEVTYYACTKQELHQVYPRDTQPISEPGSSMDVVEDDGTKAFDKLYQDASKASVKRMEKK